MDTRVHAVADDGAELTTAGVNEFARDHRTMRSAIVSEVRNNRARSEINLLSQNGIPDVGEVPDVRLIKEDRVLELHGLPDVTTIPNRSGTADIAVGPDLTARTDDDVAFNDDAR